jgi:Ca2+-binding EF-hand superfamily protein
MFDRDRKGTINQQEFGALFNYINQWKATFEAIDRDKSGFIEHTELMQGIVYVSRHVRQRLYGHH